MSILYLGLLAGLVGGLWGLSEIVGAFKDETGRALQNGGAWLLLGINFLFAAGIYLVISVLVNGANHWIVALFMGLAWPTVLRNASFKLGQPLIPSEGRDPAVIRLEVAYEKVQDLAYQLINSALTRQRIGLLSQVNRYELAELEIFTRRAIEASPLQDDLTTTRAFIGRISNREIPDASKKDLLVALLLRKFGRHVLTDFMREQEERPRQIA
ncbi:MAG: hypothetical protein AAF702_49715 [Chloroflexota bacterium]